MASIKGFIKLLVLKGSISIYNSVAKRRSTCFIRKNARRSGSMPSGLDCMSKFEFFAFLVLMIVILALLG